MAKARAKVKVDVSELSEWADKLRQLAEKEYQEFQLKAVRVLAGEFVERAMARTPIGKYGKLRVSWKVGDITKVKGGYEVEIYNDATNKGESYASHVEFGHRIMNKKGGEVKGFVRGKKMMTNTEIEMVFISEELLEKEFELFLEEHGI